MRQHDADLCERIRALEKEVADLKAKLETHRGLGQHHGWWITPYQPWPNYYPWYTTTTGQVSTGTAPFDSNQFTLTGGNSW